MDLRSRAAVHRAIHARRLLLGDAPGHPFRGNQWKDGDGLSYDSLSKRDFKVSKAEAAIVMQRSHKAEKAAGVLKEALAQDEASFGSDVAVVRQALDVLRRRVIPRALLNVQEDEEPLFD